MPSLPDTVARMPPPTRIAVTVAPATGSFAEFVTIPTSAPDDTFTTGDAFTTGAVDSSAQTATRTQTSSRLRRGSSSNRKYFVDRTAS